MKEKAVMPLVISMAIPMTISMLVNSLYNIIDSFYVAKISEQAMTALSLVYPAQNLLSAVSVGFAIGVNAVIAYYLGAGLKKLADTAATRGLLFSFLHGFLIGTRCIVGMPAFLGRFSSDSEIIHLGTQYANIVFLFGIPIGAGVSYEKTFQAIGRMKVSMVSMLVGCYDDGVEGDSYYVFEGQTIGDYLDADSRYSEFSVILERAGMKGLMYAYGDYTCFAPTNEAVEHYINSYFPGATLETLPDSAVEAVA